MSEKVTFNGTEKRIYVNEDVTEISVRKDLYSAWVRWSAENSMYLPAFRVVGLDPIGGGKYTGDFYFLMNDWQVVVGHFVEVEGILYSDNPALKPFIVLAGGGVTSTVSAMAIAYDTGSSSAVSISDEDAIKIGRAVWNRAVSEHTGSGTFGEFISKRVLTVAKFLGLK